ncbi:MAG: hypothetical protein R2809_01600 [Flavobacteriales bacterium]
MNDQVKFKRLQELISALQEGMDELNVGKLTVDQLESLTEHSRELYERLVVLRFKAYDNLAKKDTQAAPPVENVAPVAPIAPPVVQETAPTAPVVEETAASEEFPMPFKLNVSPNQVSLIDAIEEVTKETEEEPVTNTSSINDELKSPQESLHEKLSKIVAQSASLAEKMESTPIQDLKRAITLNQRFQFSKELFKGNNEDYEVAIDRLNTTTREEALKQLDVLKSKYQWNNEAQVTQDFLELVERRHQL